MSSLISVCPVDHYEYKLENYNKYCKLFVMPFREEHPYQCSQDDLIWNDTIL